MENSIQFILNHELVILEKIDPNLTVLQYLREIQFLTGTKEGCASGDCGACTVVVAELSASNPNHLDYKSINACITLVATLQGKQLITVEHLKQGAKLHQVQQSIIDNHASQCGFCTPGFVMSCFALLKNNPSPNKSDVTEALAGNLCRCTGYRSIIDAAMASTQSTPNELDNNALEDNFSASYKKTIQQLSALQHLPVLNFECSNRTYFAPKNIEELQQQLISHPDASLFAGGTDLALNITQNLQTYEKLIYTGNVQQLNEIETNQQQIIIGSAVTYDRFTALLKNEFPELGAMIERIGSMQIRNMGTLGGNIGNASPIADMPPALIALGASITLQKGEETRDVLVEDYYVDYKKTILQASEFISKISLPRANPEQVLKLYKISKRFDDDISAVLAALFIEVKDNIIVKVRIAFGGMAATPKRAMHCEAALINKTLNVETIRAAQQSLVKDFQPMTDVRATAQYRMRIAQNLLYKCYLELQNTDLQSRVEHYA